MIRLNLKLSLLSFFNFDEKIQSTIPNILSKNELKKFKRSLIELTKDLVLEKKGKIDEQIAKIDILQKIRMKDC